MRLLFPAKHRLFQACQSGLASLGGRLDIGLLDGMVVSLFLVAMWHQLSATLGGSLATEFSVGWALSIGVVLGLGWRSRRGWLLLGLVGWSAGFGVVLSLIGWVLTWFSGDQLAAANGLPATLPLATLALSIPVACSVRLGLMSGRQRSRGFLVGAAAGALLAVHLLIGWMGVDAALLVATVLGGILFLLELYRGELTRAVVETRRESSWRIDWPSAVWLSSLGVVLAAMDRMLVQLVPASEWYVLTIVVGLCLGAAVFRPRRSQAIAAAVAATILLVPVLFPELVGGLLHLKVVGGHPAVLIVAWSVVILLAVTPVGWLLARGVRVRAESDSRPIPSVAPLLVLAGLFVCRGVWIPAVGPVVCAVVGVWCLAIVAGLVAWSCPLRRAGLFGPGRLVLPLAGLVVLTVLSGRYDSEQSARLLFSGRVIAAAEHEWPERLHESLDETRLIERRETGDATLTVWSQQGSRRLLRVDGVPTSAWSADAAISPRHRATVLEVVVPLVLHERPERVLMLGLGGGEGLRAGLGFPLGRVDCVVPDRSLRELVAGDLVFDDARLDWRHVPCALAVSAATGDYDVVIATSAAGALWRSESTRTLEFYRNAARQLTAEGIFCQSISQRDLGPSAVMVVMATVQAAFGSSVQVAVGDGRVLILATNGSTLVDRPGLISRLQGPHVRTALAEIGWDWANLLQLPARLPASSVGSVAWNHVGHGGLATRLPAASLSGSLVHDPSVEGAMQPVRTLLSLARIENEWVAEVRERLVDVLKGRKLLSRGADGIRAYRNSVDKQILSRPRFVFRSDSDQGIRRVRHPVDRRRQQFLKVLASADASKRPSADQIQRVVAFGSPFDPLLSEFIHREAAALWARQSGDSRGEELRHRLHAVYFGTPAVSGVDDVHLAIEVLLTVRPNEVEAAVDWDHCNALLEVLKQRWSSGSSNRLGTDEARLTIELVGRVMDRMDGLIELDSSLGRRWAERREVVERGLIDPLRLSRSRRGRRVLAN